MPGEEMALPRRKGFAAPRCFALPGWSRLPPPHAPNELSNEQGGAGWDGAGGAGWRTVIWGECPPPPLGLWLGEGRWHWLPGPDPIWLPGYSRADARAFITSSEPDPGAVGVSWHWGS